MNERLQVTALFRAFLARFFENEISENSRDMRASFSRIIGMLAAPGLLLPVSNLWVWGWLALQGPDVFRRGIIADKVLYVSVSMSAMMLLAAIVWQALLVDRRDAIVLGSFPVRPRTIIAGKLAALFAYLAIVGGGMHVVASVLYGTILGNSLAGALRAVPAHFIASTLASMFACVTVAAFQAAVLAAGGPRLFARLTAPAQLLLATTGLTLLLASPVLGGAAVDLLRGNERSAWIMLMPPMWFVGVYEVIAGHVHTIMPAMAARALVACAAAAGLLVAAYPLAYRRIASAAMQGSPLGTRQSIASRLLARMIRALPLRSDTRGAVHFILLTTGRVARNKLIGATALGAGLALSMPFILRWIEQDWVPQVPARSHIAVAFVFVMFGLAGLRMAYNIPAEISAAWIFSTAVRPARIGTSAARVVGVLVGSIAPAALCLAIMVWFWGPAIAMSAALTVFAFGCLISEIGLRSVDFVPYTRAYSAERGKIQARWPLYLILMVLFLQILPSIVRVSLVHQRYWIVPALLAGIAIALRLSHPPEPPPLVDADFENKPLALRLY